MSKSLLEPILDGGISSVNFFNGRLLSAEDLTAEQAANMEAHRRMGVAMGDGIAFGLEVAKAKDSTADAPLLTVTPGLAVTRSGYTLGLSDETRISLVRPPTGSASVGQTGFKACQPLQTGVFVSGEGVYLLTMAPAQVRQGLAPVSGLGNAVAACNSKYIVGGVQFRLIQIDLAPEVLSDSAHLRNRLAYACFGVTQSTAFLVAPLTKGSPGKGLLDDMRPGILTDCDVPLALIDWAATGGIRFIDLWAARRRLARPSPVDVWSWFASDRRASEAEAMFFQFDDHLRDLREAESNLDTLVASQRFDFLPPVGLLPLTGVGTAPGFTYQKFFEQQAAHPPVHLEGALVEPLIRMALPHAPINLPNKDPIKLFLVVDGTVTRPYVLFMSAYVPFQADSRFDITRWNFSNFA